MGYLRSIAALVVLATLGGCQVEDADVTELQPVGTELVERQRLQCEEDGGRWAGGGEAGGLVCYVETPDANKSCSTSADCSGLCLARSRTCTPVTPFFGCHEVLNAVGGRQTLCIE